MRKYKIGLYVDGEDHDIKSGIRIAIENYLEDLVEADIIKEYNIGKIEQENINENTNKLDYTIIQKKVCDFKYHNELDYTREIYLYNIKDNKMFCLCTFSEMPDEYLNMKVYERTQDMDDSIHLLVGGA